MSMMMTSPSDSQQGASYVRTRREAPLMWVLGTRVRMLVDSTATAGRYSLAEVFVPPSTKGPPPHSHADCDELFHLLEGGLNIFADGAWRTLHAGDTAIASRGTLHTFDNPFLSPCRLLVQITPAGFERFFFEVGVAAKAGTDPIRAPIVEPIPRSKLKELSLRHHMTIPGITDA